jgi:hypothetical protein
MLFAPKGIWGYLAERYGLALFPIRRRLVANAHEDAREPPPGASPPAGSDPWRSEQASVSVWGGFRLSRGP